MLTKTLPLAALLALSSLGQAALAAVHHVPAEFATIQEAVDAAEEGDKIVIGPGKYPEDVDVCGKTGITLIGKSGHEISPVGEETVGVTVSASENVTLKRLRIVGGSGIAVESTDFMRIRKCEIFDCDNGIRVRTSDGCLIVRNRLETIRADAIVLGPSEATRCDFGVVLRNQVIGCDASGIAVTGSNNDVAKNVVLESEGIGVIVTGIASLTGDPDFAAFNSVRLNTIAFAGDWGIGLFGSGPKVIKNTVFETGGDGIRVDASRVTLLRNRLEDIGDDGIDVHGTSASTFKRNRVKRANGAGVRLTSEATGILLIRNVVSDSGEDDFRNFAPLEENTFVKNSFSPQ